MTNWRNKIVIKKYLSSDTSDKAVLRVCERIIPNLKIILNFENRRIENGRMNALNEHFVYEFEEVIQEFEWIADCINKNEDPNEYSYDDWCEALNNYLTQLYDLGDTVTAYSERFGGSEKFLWVG
ncbi:hypothetical protein [Priestia megaterium]|uniref:hypothetical protein n=1 Tax=Priestia megaterium TaxID=1404 RepID=UPI00287761D9|nr:hypothetical protein [Priestia megaterium]